MTCTFLNFASAGDVIATSETQAGDGLLSQKRTPEL